jgi:hypothetical protein
MWTYLLGPLFAVFPKPWRESLPYLANVQWSRATAISGLTESVLALLALMHWYSLAMTTWVGNGIATALSGKSGPGIEPQMVGAVALTVWATHPLTWLLGYAGLEGAIRSCAAAFTGNSFGILLFFLIDKMAFNPFRRRDHAAADAAVSVRSNLTSFASAIHERIAAATLPEVSDEISFTKRATEEILEIRASRRKQDWIPPRVVRYQDAYFRLEAASRGAAPRPFIYTLLKLSAGVSGRTVLLYAPSDAVIRNAG